jgi:hypothetical protein
MQTDPTDLDETERRPPAGVVQPTALVRAAEAAAALAFQVPLANLRSAQRCTASIVRARQTAIYLVRVGFEMSYTDLGRSFGRDRTTAAHACRAVEDRRDDARFDCGLSALEAGLARWHHAFGALS